MRCFILGTVGVPACYGGFETLAENLIGHTGELQFVVLCSTRAYTEKKRNYRGAELIYVPLKANGVQSILYDGVGLLMAAVSRADVIILLGVSGAIFLPIIRRITKIKVITNIDGIEWQRAKWNSFIRWFLRKSEALAIRYSHRVIADNHAIAEYIHSSYSVDAEVIAYGGDHVLVKDVSGVREEYALALCRIEPENNVHLILDAFAVSEHPLVFVGNWDANDYSRELRRRYGSFAHLSLLDPIYDLDALFELRDRSAFYVHGHSAGGTNPSLVEIMQFGKAVLAFDCVYNRATTENQALYFSDGASLAFLIGHLSDWVLKDCGEKMKIIADRRYTWTRVREQYFRLILEG
jgi:glycosyltransferase involved in cell wall biosynthesis